MKTLLDYYQEAGIEPINAISKAALERFNERIALAELKGEKVEVTPRFVTIGKEVWDFRQEYPGQKENLLLYPKESEEVFWQDMERAYPNE